MFNLINFGKEFRPLLEPWYETARKNGWEKIFMNQVNEVCLTIRFDETPLPHWNEHQNKLYSMLLIAKRIRKSLNEFKADKSQLLFNCTERGVYDEAD